MFQKRRAEKALEDSGLQYVIVRPGGMERPTDDFKLTNNVRLSTRDTLFGGQVSRLQVAELVAASLSNPSLAENKVTHFCLSALGILITKLQEVHMFREISCTAMLQNFITLNQTFKTDCTAQQGLSGSNLCDATPSA